MHVYIIEDYSQVDFIVVVTYMSICNIIYYCKNNMFINIIHSSLRVTV